MCLCGVKVRMKQRSLRGKVKIAINPPQYGNYMVVDREKTKVARKIMFMMCTLKTSLGSLGWLPFAVV